MRHNPDRWSVRCAGILDTHNASAVVQPELIKLHEAVRGAGVRHVELEVHDVEYMNSSGLKSFMVWFLAAANAREGRYQIDVVFDPGRSWQQLSFHPMERLAPNTVKLVPRAG